MAEGREQRPEGKRQGKEVIPSPSVVAHVRRGEKAADQPPEDITGGGSFTPGDRAILNCPGHQAPVEEVRPLVPSQKTLHLSPKVSPVSISGEMPDLANLALFGGADVDGMDHVYTGICPAVSQVKKDDRGSDLVGLKMHELGLRVHQKLLEVLPLRGSTTGERNIKDIFPLPTSKSFLVSLFPLFDEGCIHWLLAVCLSLNSMWGGNLHFNGKVSKVASDCLHLLAKEAARLFKMECRFENFCWDEFFNTRGIDYKGDEVKTARSFGWENIRPALPPEIGRVPLESVCKLGAQHYVEHFDSYIKSRDSWNLARAPKVMVPDDKWADVCSGLLGAGVCTFLPVEDIYDTGQGPLLNGLFGVTKEEWDGTTEVFRLIMNMIPLNRLAQPLKGDVETLPSWSLMNPFFLQPEENLLISSEDVRCFFYTMPVPVAWHKYLAFNKRVPDSCLDADMQGREVYLASRVLPMGFLNSVALAQHVHRNLTLWSSGQGPEGQVVNPPEAEIRKDRPLTAHAPAWRIYLDNYDLLEKVKATGIGSLEGTLAPSVLALRHEYEVWEIPRNIKKSVSRQLRAEVQGAQVDGEEGVAYPREAKLLKYLGAALSLMDLEFVSQKQAQVVCGGLVYIAMFRRPLLGCLNAVWVFIESFNGSPLHRQRLPAACKAEVMRFVSLIPLARLDFRLPFSEQVTCSDASTSGGGICASAGCSRWGALVSQGKLRGELPELRQEHQVLTIGLFDGIAALRVAVDLLGLQLVGHISVEVDDHASRVVESHFPEVRRIKQVQDIDEDTVREWACNYSQASVVLVGGGPPCQGVSGLNADRKGALRDQRSRLFVHVPRVMALVRLHFPWCQVHGLMESVSSMDSSDRQVMSQEFGSEPWKCDAGTMTWGSRPRLYWVTWGLYAQPGVAFHTETIPREVVLEAQQDLQQVCQEGWIKTDCTRPFPTFTTSRPRLAPGRKPAGLQQCTAEEVMRWQHDQHRFPPYQYANRNLLINKSNELRLPSIEEKEFIMGFPVDYTLNCVTKQQRGTQHHQDVRHSLVGNSWSVPVVAWLLSQLFGPLGLCPRYTPQELVDLLTPDQQIFLQSRLWRRPLRPLRGDAPEAGQLLVRKLSNMISVKGEDILLTTPSSQLTRFHRLRASVPARLWRWRVVSGWRWTGAKEHINSLELRSVLTTLKWRLQHKGQVGKRFIHLVVAANSVLRCRASTRSCFALPLKPCGAMFKLTRTLPTVQVGGGGRSKQSSVMPKRILEGITQSERARQRQRLGTLQQLTVQPATKARYQKAVDQFLEFLRHSNQLLPKQRHLLDPLVCEFLEHLWAKGSGRALASDTLAGLQDQDPKLKGHLPGAWRLLKTWSVNEVPNRAPPLPEHVLHAMVGWAFFHDNFSFGISLLLGYYAMLRTGELLGLSSRNPFCDNKQSKVIVSLGLTKAGKRLGASESCVVGYDMVVSFLRQWKSIAEPTQGFSPNPAKWRALFNQALEALELQSFQFRPYSLRRGGATWWFTRHHSLIKFCYKAVGKHPRLLGFISMRA